MPEEPNIERKSPTNYSGNSQKAKRGDDVPPEQEKRVEKLVSGEITQRKKPLGRKIAETFSGDDAQSVGQYVLFEVIIPATKNLIFDMIREGADRLLFGSSGRGRLSGPGLSRGSGFTNYSKMYTGGGRMDIDRPDGGRKMSASRETPSTEWTEVVIPDRGEAQLILDKLYEIGDEYGVVRVTDLKDALGVTTSYVDNDWGWDDLRGSEIRSVREGFLLRLPKPIPINR